MFGFLRYLPQLGIDPVSQSKLYNLQEVNSMSNTAFGILMKLSKVAEFLWINRNKIINLKIIIVKKG